MACVTVMTFVLVSLACSSAADKGLRLKSYSKDEAKGCYKHNQTFGVCFDMKRGSMKIEKTTGEDIVHYQELGPDMFLYQVVDQDFIGHGPSMFYIPDDVPRNPEALQVFVKNMAEDETLHREDLKTHYQAAMNELRKVPEVQLLERVSTALGDNSTRLEILQPFHALCFNLLKQADVDVSSELRAVHDMEEEAADLHEQEKRCTSMENRQQDINCRGMCGNMCSCWWWVCGDCCYHQGCCEHDVCCNENPLSSYCLIPHVYGFRCSGFGGYPACKKKVGGHRIEAVGPAKQNHGVSRLNSSIMTTLIRDLYYLLCFTVCFSVTTVFVKVVLLSNKSNVRNF